MNYGLSPGDTVAWACLTEEELDLERSRARPLLEAAARELDQLSHLASAPGCCIVLSNRVGILLDRCGGSHPSCSLGLSAGCNWSEQFAGTNPIGTSIADGRTLTVIRGQHFLAANIGLSGTSAPIRDHLGHIFGAIAMMTTQDDVSETLMQLYAKVLRDAASRIETGLFVRAHAGNRVAMVSSEHSSGVALIAVDRDDIVVGANRAARFELGLDRQKIQSPLTAADALQEDIEAVDKQLQDAERAALRRALCRNNNSVLLTAQSLGMSRSTLHRKIKRLGVSQPQSITNP